MNYKPYGHVVQLNGNLHRPLLGNEKSVILWGNWSAANHNPRSLFDSTTASTIYQVPTGKTYKIIALVLIGVPIAQIPIYQGDTADAITTLKWSMYFPITGTYELEIPNVEIASGKFVTIDPTVAGISNFIVYGVEY